jgi:histidinol-phosphate/aromatic aminotransferase/cobyric acid decarboxylase-like protein
MAQNDLQRDNDLKHHGDVEARPGLIDLAVNVRLGPVPGWLGRALRESLGGLARYPNDERAVAAVARRHGRSTDEVLLTAGAAQAFTLVAQAFRAARQAVVVHPQFTEPEAALRAAGHEVHRRVLAPPFVLEPAMDGDLVVLGNPTNPTSVLHPAATIERLARPGRILVVDEAFADTVPGEPESLAGRRDLPGLLVVRSLTKTWGLAGLRVGYVLGPPDLIARLREVCPLWPVSTPGLAAIEACLSAEALALADSFARRLVGERDELVLGLGGLVVGEPRSSFVLARVPIGTREALHSKGWAVRRGDTFPGLGPQYIRIAVRDPATTRAFLKGLGEVL